MNCAIVHLETDKNLTRFWCLSCICKSSAKDDECFRIAQAQCMSDKSTCPSRFIVAKRIINRLLLEGHALTLSDMKTIASNALCAMLLDQSYNRHPNAFDNGTIV